jgi:hypothetical protein
MKYTIGITTFEHRFENYFKPLLLQIKKNLPDIEVIVYINGEINKSFDENYRKKILSFISEQKNVFPIISPYFRSLSKLWNSLIIQSTNDDIFIFNDDIWLEDAFFKQINDIEKMEIITSFRLNGSFSHFCVNRKEVFEVGFFDEKLIGLGEEDGDWCFRWEKFYQKHLPSLQTPFIKRFEGYSNNLKETPWNSDWIFKNKYDADNDVLAISQGFPANGAGGMYGKPVALRKDYVELDLYPAEKFFWEHISELNENFGIKNK